MKYVVLIHSNPQPWGHPTADYIEEHQALPAERRKELGDAFDALMGDMHEKGELVGGQALGDPASAKIYRWDDGPVETEGPYSESKEHLAGFFIVDVEDPARAAEVGRTFAGPGEAVEVRPVMVFEES